VVQCRQTCMVELLRLSCAIRLAAELLRLRRVQAAHRSYELRKQAERRSLCTNGPGGGLKGSAALNPACSQLRQSTTRQGCTCNLQPGCQNTVQTRV